MLLVRQVENAVKALIVAKDHSTISKILALVIHEFALSPVNSRRKVSFSFSSHTRYFML